MALINLTTEFSRKNIEEAKRYAHRARALASKLKNDLVLSSSYSFLVVLHQNSNDLDSARQYLDKIKRLLEEQPQNNKIKINYNNSAGLFYKNQGLLKQALPHMLDNLQLLVDENETRAGLFLNLGNLYYSMGEFQHAATNHLSGLTLFEKLNNKRGQSFCMQSLGNDFRSLHELDKAKDYFLSSITMKTELQDRRGMITSLRSLAETLLEQKKFESSKRYLIQALQLSQEMNLTAEEVRCQYLFGLVYKQTGEIVKARSTIEQALQLAKQTVDSTLVAKISGELAALKDPSNEKELEYVATTNIKVLQNSGDRNAVAMEYERLSQYFESNKQFEKALLYRKRYQALKDSLEGTAVQVQVQQLEKQYQSERKEAEISLLRKEQEIKTLALSRQRLITTVILIAMISLIVIGVLFINRYRVMSKTKRQVELEKIRTNIARDLHDDVGSTLSSINILSQLALVEQNGETVKYLQRINDQSTRMMENMSDMVWSINPRNDTLGKVISQMRIFAGELFEDSGVEVRFQMTTDDTQVLSSDKRKNLFLIFKEALNNAAKYSKANQVTILLQQDKGMLTMVVRDNGSGFDELKVKSGNGLRNMSDRANQINANLTLTTNIAVGTQWTLILPLA
ncbi:MAG: histidine kinase [Cyclobacteriaceae bacterium]